MRGVRTIVLAVLVVGLFSANVSADNPGLYKVSKAQTASLTVLKRLGVEVLQELRTCYIVRADRTDISALRKNGIGASVLARDAGGRTFLLVQAGTEETLAALRAAGRATLVEPGTALFWTEAGDPAGSLPEGARWKRLSDVSFLARLKAAPAKTTTARLAISADPDVALMVADVSEANLRSLVAALESFQTRNTYAAGSTEACEYIYDYFAGIGLDAVRYQSFAGPGGTTPRNVIADKTGETAAGDIVIVCGHYDSTSPTPSTLAPGADDNGSGTAAVLEAARVLASHDFDFTLRFIAFAAEEQGLYGSSYYAGRAAADGERVLGVINLDMIAYADALPEDVSLIVNDASSWLADRMAAAATAYGSLTSDVVVNASFVYSDHAPFWDEGYPALLAIEDEPLANPYYHRTTDTSSTLSFGFFTSVTRAAAGLAAELAQPARTDRPATPTGLTMTASSYGSLLKTLKKVVLTWSAQDDAAGYNVYRTTLSHEGYEKLNASPIAATTYADVIMDASLSYYYVVTAVGPTGLESNYSQETGVAASAATFMIKIPEPESGPGGKARRP